MEGNDVVRTRARGRLLASFLLVALASLTLSACGPAFRFRPANILPKGDVEIGGGLGTGARAENGNWGGAELQAWVRWAPKKRFETSHRFWTHTFSSIGWEPEFRIQAVRGPFDLTIEFAPMFSLCCGVGTEQKFLSAGLGFDVGIAVGKRFGGPQSAAIYFAPHYQMTWTFPPDAGWDGHRLLNLPVGLDIPMGKSPFAIRPEIMVVSVIRPSGFAPLWRVGGGVAIALQGMGPKKLKAFNEAKAAGKPLPDDWDKKKKKGKKGKKVPEAKEEEPAPAPAP